MARAEDIPQFAVIIPTHNYGHFLREAIDSALGQTGATFEVIVVDDDSTDDTADIVASYGDRVAYFRQNRSGPCVACKRGMEKTTGTYIVFLAADDRLRPGALAHAAERFAEHPEARMLFGPWVTLRPDGSERLSETPVLSDDCLDNFTRYVHGKLRVSAGGSVLHREVFDRLWSVPEPFFHGYDRVMVGQGLSWYRAIGTSTPLFDLRDHAARMRENVDSALSAGLRAAEALFHPSIIPAEAMKLRGVFVANLLLEQARLLYRHRRHGDACRSFARAFRERPASMLQKRALRRFLQSGVLACFIGPNGNGGVSHGANGSTAVPPPEAVGTE